MIVRAQTDALQFLDSLVADGLASFTFDQAVLRSGRSRTATANLLKRMVDRGLLDRVRRGHYALRRFGVLGTSAAAEDIALAVGAAFSERPHRIAYRSALSDHDLLTHPARTIQVAATSRTRSRTLSDRPLQVIIEPESHLLVGTISRHSAHISGLERALLDGGARPELVGGASALAEALWSAQGEVRAERLQRYAEELGASTAIRRLASLSDHLDVKGLKGVLKPILEPKGDIDLEPKAKSETVFRDSRWRVKWPLTPEELKRSV